MQGLYALMVTATVPSMLFQGAAPVGEIGPHKVVSLPFQEDGTALLTSMPLGPNYAPICRQVRLREGQPEWNPGDSGIHYTQWPRGIIEVQLCPPTLHGEQKTLIPELLRRAEIHSSAFQGQASLVGYDGVWLVVEDQQGNILLDQRLDGWASVENLTILQAWRTPAVAVEGRDLEEKARVAIARAHGAGWRLEQEGPGVMSLSDGKITTSQHLEDTAGHVACCAFDEAETQRSVCFEDTRRMPQTAEETARAMLEALLLDQPGEAMEYLSSALQEELGGQQLAEYIGPFSGIAPSRYAPRTHETTWSLTKKQSPGVTQAEPLVFTMIRQEDDAGEWKVDNIRPMECE